MPLLQLVQSSGSSEQDLHNRAAGVIRSRFGKAREAPVTTDTELPAAVLSEIHAMARKAASAELSQMCSVCSIFVCRGLEASHPTSTIAADAYRQTMDDYLSRKQSSVHAAFVVEFMKRFPVRAWALRDDLCKHLIPGEGANAYRQTQGYGMLQSLVQQLSTVAKSVSTNEIAAFVKTASTTINATLVAASSAGGSDWKADRLKDVLKFGLLLARMTKHILGAEGAAQAWDVQGLSDALAQLVAGERTSQMKGPQGLIAQIQAILAVGGGSKKASKKDKKAKVPAGNGDKMDVDGEHQQLTAAKVNGQKAEKKDGVKKRKSVDGQAAAAEGKVKRKSSSGDKQAKKVRIAA